MDPGDYFFHSFLQQLDSSPPIPTTWIRVTNCPSLLGNVPGLALKGLCLRKFPYSRQSRVTGHHCWVILLLQECKEHVQLEACVGPTSPTEENFAFMCQTAHLWVHRVHLLWLLAFVSSLPPPFPLWFGAALPCRKTRNTNV